MASFTIAGAAAGPLEHAYNRIDTVPVVTQQFHLELAKLTSVTGPVGDGDSVVVEFGPRRSVRVVQDESAADGRQLGHLYEVSPTDKPSYDCGGLWRNGSPVSGPSDLGPVEAAPRFSFGHLECPRPDVILAILSSGGSGVGTVLRARSIAPMPKRQSLAPQAQIGGVEVGSVKVLFGQSKSAAHERPQVRKLKVRSDR